MSETSSTWFEVQNIERIDTPALLLYKDRIQQNITTAKDIVGDVTRLRPHVKTHKCVGVSQMLLEAGVTKFKCATIAEAEMLGMAKAPDVLLAYQPTIAKMHRLIALIKNYPQTVFSCLIDNPRSARMIAEAAGNAGLVIPVFIDVNIGMNRTGVLPENVVELYKACALLTGIKIKGVHAYDGHINTPDLQERTAECHAAYQPLKDILPEIEAQGYERPVVVSGGTPTFPVFAQMDDVECSPGTFVFWDDGYGSLFPDLAFFPAALVATRVISVLDEYTVCLDMGHKAISAENPLSKRVKFLNAPVVEFVGHSEEHMVIKTPAAHQLQIGDVLYGLPYHICPTCNLYNSASVVNDGLVTGQWDIIARDRVINF